MLAHRSPVSVYARFSPVFPPEVHRVSSSVLQRFEIEFVNQTFPHKIHPFRLFTQFFFCGFTTFYMFINTQVLALDKSGFSEQSLRIFFGRVCLSVCFELGFRVKSRREVCFKTLPINNSKNRKKTNFSTLYSPKKIEEKSQNFGRFIDTNQITK